MQVRNYWPLLAGEWQTSLYCGVQEWGVKRTLTLNVWSKSSGKRFDPNAAQAGNCGVPLPPSRLFTRHFLVIMSAEISNIFWTQCLGIYLIIKGNQNRDIKPRAVRKGTDAFWRSPEWPHANSHIIQNIKGGSRIKKWYTATITKEIFSTAHIPQNISRWSPPSSTFSNFFGIRSSASWECLQGLLHLCKCRKKWSFDIKQWLWQA